MKPFQKTGAASLRRTFLYYIILAYAAIALATYFAFSAGAERVSARYAARYAVSQGELERNRILSLVDQDLALARKLADDPQIRAWMGREGDGALESEAMAQLESYRKFFRDGTWFLAIGSSGSYWARNQLTPRPERTTLSPDNPADRWFYAALQDGRDYSLNVDHNAMLGENRVWINVLVRDGKGRAIGLAGCGLNLTSFLDSLVSGEEGGVNVVVVDGKGALMAYRDRGIIAHNAEVKRDSDKIDVYGFLASAEDREGLRAAIAAAGQGERPGVLSLRMSSSGPGPSGARQLCSVSALPELGWYGLVFVQAERILGPSDFLPMILVTLASLLVVLALVIAGMSALVVEPIRKLNSAAGEVAAGAYDVVLPEVPRNEVGLLASSFNVMARKVKAYTAGLEEEVASRTALLVEANGRLEASQARIMDSIHYARLIQESSQPDPRDLDAALSDHFEILRERDVVGGDFFFFRPTEEGFCAAVADCTGHGVPGAFMAMMAKAHLDRLVESSAASHPSQILADLDRLILASLKSEASIAHLENGLDMAFCRYRASDSSLEFAGAGLPLYVWTKGRLEEIPGDRSHIGFSASRREKSWGDHRVELSGGGRIFLVTDGVLDLPGGEAGLPFGRSRLRRLLESLAGIPLAEAGRAAEAALDEYRGDRPQRDDLCFVGLGPRGME
jgi:serine phosphatase RsbU (regulator of sigma subunit)